MDEAYIRPMIYVGEGAMGIYVAQQSDPRVHRRLPLGRVSGHDALANGIRVKISSWARHHISVSLAKAKTMGQYTNSVLAKAEAKLAGYDEAVLLDTQGYVSEGLGREYLHRQERPARHAAALQLDPRRHHTRHRADAGARRGHSRSSKSGSPAMSSTSPTRSFFTGTAAEVTPVREVDDRADRRRAGGAHYPAPAGSLLRDCEGGERSPSRMAHPTVAPTESTKTMARGRRAKALTTLVAPVFAFMACASAPPPPGAGSPPLSPAAPGPTSWQEARWGTFHSKRFEVSLGLPDGAAWKIR